MRRILTESYLRVAVTLALLFAGCGCTGRADTVVRPDKKIPSDPVAFASSLVAALASDDPDTVTSVYGGTTLAEDSLSDLTKAFPALKRPQRWKVVQHDEAVVFCVSEDSSMALRLDLERGSTPRLGRLSVVEVTGAHEISYQDLWKLESRISEGEHVKREDPPVEVRFGIIAPGSHRLTVNVRSNDSAVAGGPSSSAVTSLSGVLAGVPARLLFADGRMISEGPYAKGSVTATDFVIETVLETEFHFVVPDDVRIMNLVLQLAEYPDLRVGSR